MKKYIRYLLLVGPAILVVTIFFVRDTSAVLTNIQISPPNQDRTICTYQNGTSQVATGCDEAETTRIACPSSDVLCGYEGGWKMCVPRDFQRTINELCADYTVTIAGNPAPVVSVEGSPNVDQRSYCSSLPNDKKDVCPSYANDYLICAGENDKVCRRADQQNNGSSYYSYGCVQTSNCTDVMGIFVTATDITSSARWAKFISNGLPAAGNEGTCKKTYIVNESGAASAGVTKTYATKQECESASTTSPPSPSDTCTADVWSCGSWSACSAEKTQTRTCSLTYDCKNTDQPSKPVESKSCTAPEPEPASDPNQCPRKPDSAKGTGEPAALPAGAEIKQVPSYYIWGCYSQPDKTSNSECTAQATKRTGNITSPCVFGQESVVCPSKGTAYKEGNFLKCAPVKLPKNEEKKDERENGRSNETTVITQTIERIVTVEVPSSTSIVPPEVVTDESCKTYKEEVDEKVISQGDAFLNAADAAFKSTAVNNPAFKKVFYGMLKESAKKSRKLQKLVNAKTCDAEAVTELHSTVKDFEAGELEKVKQTLAFLDKETKVQNQYVGINEDFKWVEKFAKSLKPGSSQATLFVEEIGTFEQMRIDFQDILNAEKEGKVFGFEVEAIAQQAKELRNSIEKKRRRFLPEERRKLQ